MNTAEIAHLVCEKIPYWKQMQDLDASVAGEVRFTWRGKRFRVDSSLNVESVKDGFLHGCNESILLQALLKQP